MKKMCLFLLCISMIVMLATTAVAEELFSMFDNVVFGMSEQEVIDFAATQGVSLNSFDDWAKAPMGAAAVTGATLLHSRGETGSDMFKDLSFIISPDNELVAVAYSASNPEATVNQICSVLTNKYGEPISTANNYIDFGTNWDAIDHLENTNSIFNTVKCKASYQWIYPLEDGYADIMLVHYTYDFVTYPVPNYVVTYTYRTTEEYNSCAALQ